jgi:rod shape-determining protein MreD
LKFVRGALLVAGAMVFQLILSGIWPITLYFVDLPLLVVLYYALNRGPTVGLTLGGAVGLLQDSLTGSLLGVGAVARGLVGYAVGSASTRLVFVGRFPQILLVAAGTLLSNLLEASTLALMGRQMATPSIAGLLAVTVGNSLLGGLLLVLCSRESEH